MRIKKIFSVDKAKRL